MQLTLSLQDADGNLNDVPVKWIDWTTQSGTTVSGAFNTETGVVNASLTSSSSYAGVQLSGGTNYFNPTSPYISDGVAAPTSSDIIRFNPAGWRTLSFDSEVRNLYFAFVSMNGNGYRFDRDFDIISQTDNPDTSEDEGGGLLGFRGLKRLKSSLMDKLIGSSELSMVNRMALSSSRVPFRI